jgi:hypothetical protein
MTIHRFLPPVGLAAGALLLLSGTATAQLSSTPRALGMAGAYVASSRGHESLFLNPANLGLPGTPYWSIAIPQVNLASGIDGPTFRDAWDAIQSNGDEPAARTAAMARIPATGLDVDVHARIPLAVIQNRRFALGVAYGAVVEQSVGRDLVDLFVNGYQNGRTDYQVGNTTGSRATYFDFAAAYGRRVGPLSLGATAHFILGRSLVRSRLFEPRIDPSAETLEVEYREVLVRGGRGFGLDLGAALQPLPNLTLSASVANAAGQMKWSETLQTRAMIANQDDFGRNTMYWEEKLSAFTEGDEVVDPSAVPLAVYETARDLYREAYFPATFRSGAAYRVPVIRTQFEVGYQKQLTAGRLGDAWKERVSVGVQQKLPLITLRAGAASNLDGATQLAAGITLGGFEIGVARIRHDAAGGTPRDEYLGAIGLNVRTTGSMR